MFSSSMGKALAYLDALEADQRAALELSKQKAEEAELIKARQEGFQAALEILGVKLFAASNDEPPADRRIGHTGADNNHEEPVRRRSRRLIPQLILRELSFTGQPMTAARIAKAIEYSRERTEAMLKRMESAGQIFRDEVDRWAIVAKDHPKIDQNAVAQGSRAHLKQPQSVRMAWTDGSPIHAL
jgi:hypothetical protein